MQTADGTIQPRVYLSWTDPDLDFAVDLEIFVQIRKSDTDPDDVDEQLLVVRDPSLGYQYIEGVTEGDVVDVIATIRYDDPNVLKEGVPAFINNHTVIGKSAPPADVLGFTHTLQEDMLVLSWAANNTEIDFSHYEIRSGASWAAGTVIDTTTSTNYIINGVDVTSTTYRIKAIDTSGNESVNDDSFVFTFNNPSAVSGLSYSIDTDSIGLSWSVAVKGTFTIGGYEIREDDILIGSIDGTEFKVLTNYTGSKTYKVRAVDIYGNAGADTSQVITIGVPSSPSVSTATIVGDRVEFTWTQSVDGLTQFPIQSYEVAHGTDPVWDNNTFIVSTRTRGFSRKVDWLAASEPTRTYRVRAIDSRGNISSANTTSITITAPGSTTITTQVIDNNILLTWNEPSVHTLPIAYYEVRRGATYGTSTLVGNTNSLFSAFFETQSGTYTYWITAYDTAGNPGTNNSATAAVNQPPDFSLLVNAADDFSTIDTNWLSHTFTNAFLSANNTVVMPANITETWTNHFVNNTWTTIQNQIDASFPIYMQPTPASGSYEVEYDIGTIVNNLSITSDLTKQIVAGNPVATMRVYTKETLGGSYIERANTTSDSLQVFVTSFRYVKVLVSVASAAADTDIYELSALNIRIDVKEKTDAGAGTVTATGGTTVNFTKSFIDVTSINVTAKGTSNIVAIYDFADIPNPTSFTVYLFDGDTGVELSSGGFSWVARGY